MGDVNNIYDDASREPIKQYNIHTGQVTYICILGGLSVTVNYERKL